MNCNLLSTVTAIALLALARSALGGPGHDHPNEKPPTPPATDAHSDPDHSGSHDGHGHEEDTHADEVTLTPDAISRYGVTVATVKRVTLTETFVAPARVVFNADAMAHVGSAVTGRVSELKVRLGDVVGKGDVLMIVDSPELGEAQSDYLLKRTAAEMARPAVQLARDSYARARQLLDESQGIALAEVQKREADLRAAEGNLRAAEATATAAENKLHLYGMTQEAVATLLKSGEIVPQYNVVAPLGGQIVEREVTLGELVRPDRDALLIIADLTTVWVIADIPEARAADAVKGSVARIRSAALKDRTVEGTVTYVAPALDPNTRSAKVRVELTDPSGTLKPGMFAQATVLPATNGGSVLAVPEEAVQTVEGGPAVFVPVEGEPNTFAKKSVKIGPPVGGMVQVFDGLREGEALVTSGSFILKAELGKSGAAHEH